MSHQKEAPGGPGVNAVWAPAAKTGVGTALSPGSSVWFTISEGILTEVFYPEVSYPCTKDMGLLVTDGRDFFSEERRQTHSAVTPVADGVPAFRIVNTCQEGRYRIEKEVFTDPLRAVVLQQTHFIPLKGKLSDYHVYVLFTPHLAAHSEQDQAMVGDWRGIPLLFAHGEDRAAALVCSAPWRGRSVGYVGASDGWQDVSRHKRMTWFYERAGPGNVAMIGEVDLGACDGHFLLALGFGHSPDDACHVARAGALNGPKRAHDEYIRAWDEWQRSLPGSLPKEQRSRTVTMMSRAVLRIHEAKTFPGAIVACLATPWGAAHNEWDLGGYHLVWPRDMVEVAGGLLATGEHERTRQILTYLQTTQEADGHWFQNLWVNGSPFSRGLQLDETSLPILQVDLAYREKALDRKDLDRYWPMVRNAAAFLVRRGPVTEEDRWERNGGYAPFTLAAEIAALLVGAEQADLQGEQALAEYLRQTADDRNDRIEEWLYVTGTEIAHRCGVEGYYVRLAPAGEGNQAEPLRGLVRVSTRPSGFQASHLVGPDALALVRFGLRAPDDPHILNTLRVIDALDKIDTQFGPAWRRYNEDAYGEQKDGSPFLKAGIGRAWPLLTGERGHYELAAGRVKEARRLLRTMEGFACESGLISEQVWDAPDIPKRSLYFGRPTGSAMPLAWAHAEYLKLARSLREGRVFDMPPQPVRRYLTDQRHASHAFWRPNYPCASFPAGRTLRVELPKPARVRYTNDGSTWHEADTRDSGLGVQYLDLPTRQLSAGARVCFTFRWSDDKCWEEKDYEVMVEHAKTASQASDGRASTAGRTPVHTA